MNSEEWYLNLKRLDALEVRWKAKKFVFRQFGVINNRDIYATESGDYLFYYVQENKPSMWVMCVADQFAAYLKDSSKPSLKAYTLSDEFLPTKTKQ